MRQLLLLLLLLNGAFYLWETRLRAQFDALPATDETAGKLDSLVLIAELPPVPEIKVIDPEPTPQPAARPSAPLTSYTPSPTVKALLHPPPKPVAPPSQPASAVAATAVAEQKRPAVTGSAATNTAPAAAPAAPAAKAQETLAPPATTPPITDNKTPLPEPPKATPAAPATKPVLTGEQATPAKPADTVSQCRRIGPLPSEADAASLRRRLADGGTVSVEHKSSKTELGYWVLYPPAATLEQARTNKRNLIAKGAKDAAVLVDGDNALSVSLGFFKERAGAEKTLAEARAKGIDVNLKARMEQRDEYWLKLQAKAAAAGDSAWQAWQKEHPGTSARTGACP
ncbi:MAG: SPOR domain-containing protein [Methylococcaceae bacterium]|nr:MAG: SPOR domain-containing protein [Methylococcaceae bacterium]